MLTRTESILLVTDLSAAGMPALRRAARIAADHDAALSLLTVVDPDRPPSRRRRFAPPSDIELRLAKARSQLGGLAQQVDGLSEVRLKAVMRTADVLEHIAAAAEAADLVVMGARRDNVLREFLFGTPAERVVRISRRPVLVVKQLPVAAYRRVLVPVDFSASSALAVRLAARLAPTAEVHLFHALDEVLTSKMRTAGVAEDIIRRNRELARTRRLRELSHLGASLADARASVREGAAAALTLARQQRLGADLVIVGKQNGSRWADFLLGSVTQRLLAAATSDVLVIPKAAMREPAAPRMPRRLAAT